MNVQRPNGEIHLAGEKDIRYTRCGLWIGDETWTMEIDRKEPTCARCRAIRNVEATGAP